MMMMMMMMMMMITTKRTAIKTSARENSRTQPKNSRVQDSYYKLE
jgi:hypothetical protein